MKECLSHPHYACPCREEAFKELLEAAKGLMQIENEKWPEYVRRQFAEMRKAITLNEGKYADQR